MSVEIRPGDWVDISVTGVTEWRTVLAVGGCYADPADDSDHCDGDCLFVLTLQQVDEIDARWWHVQPGEQIRVELWPS